MTLEEMLDRESILRTLARYTTAGDRLRLEPFLEVFTEDAVLESEGVPEADAFCYRGRAQIAAWITRWSERADDTEAPTHAANFVRHHLSTSDVEFTAPDTARGRTYWTAYTDIGPDHGGYYLDIFRRCGDKWLIAHRRVRLDWRAENSLFRTAISRSRQV